MAAWSTMFSTTQSRVEVWAYAYLSLSWNVPVPAFVYIYWMLSSVASTVSPKSACWCRLTVCVSFIGCFKSPSMLWIVRIPGWLVPGWPQSHRPQWRRLNPSFTPVLKTSQMWNSEGGLIFDREAEGQENQSLGAGSAGHRGCCSCYANHRWG